MDPEEGAETFTTYSLRPYETEGRDSNGKPVTITKWRAVYPYKDGGALEEQEQDPQDRGTR